MIDLIEYRYAFVCELLLVLVNCFNLIRNDFTTFWNSRLFPVSRDTSLGIFYWNQCSIFFTFLSFITWLIVIHTEPYLMCEQLSHMAPG